VCVVKNKTGEPCWRNEKVHTQQGHSVVTAMLDKDPVQCLQDLIFKLPSNTAFKVLEWFCLYLKLGKVMYIQCEPKLPF